MSNKRITPAKKTLQDTVLERAAVQHVCKEIFHASAGKILYENVLAEIEFNHPHCDKENIQCFTTFHDFETRYQEKCKEVFQKLKKSEIVEQMAEMLSHLSNVNVETILQHLMEDKFHITDLKYSHLTPIVRNMYLADITLY